MSYPVINPDALGCPSWADLTEHLDRESVLVVADSGEHVGVVDAQASRDATVAADRDVLVLLRPDRAVDEVVGWDTVVVIAVHSADRPEHAECNRGTTGCSVHHLARERCETW